MNSCWTRVAALAAVLTVVGCDGRDQRLADLAAESNRQQAEQNRRMAELQEQVAAGTRQLVEAESAARREMIRLHESLRTEQAEVDRQRDLLNEERRSMAADRKRESLLAAVIYDVGLLLACLLPLVISLLMLTSRRDEQSSADLCDVLITELASGRPLLAASPRRALPGPSPASPADTHDADSGNPRP